MQIELEHLDSNLADDIAGDTSTGWTLHELPYAAATVSNQHWQVLWHENYRRAGVVFVGLGSSGTTYWTDASSPWDAVRRVVEDDIRN